MGSRRDGVAVRRVGARRSFGAGSNQGSALFASNCATCHGTSGQGGRNANGIAGPGIRCADSSEVLDAVVDGTGGMPAIADLTTGQIDAIVPFLRTGCP